MQKLQKSHTRNSREPSKKNNWLCFGFTEHKSEDPELYNPIGHANMEVN